LFDQLLCQLIISLIEKRVFHKLRFFSDCFLCIAIDGIGFYNQGNICTLDVKVNNVKNIVNAGRARWSIEDCFNTQKKRGGSLHHKFNRKNFFALKIRHNVRQIAKTLNKNHLKNDV